MTSGVVEATGEWEAGVRVSPQHHDCDDVGKTMATSRSGGGGGGYKAATGFYCFVHQASGGVDKWIDR